MAKKNKKTNRQTGTVPQEGTAKKVLVKTKPTVSKSGTRDNSSTRTLVFGRENYKLLGLGIGLIALGMLLMMGGFNENPAEWDADLIYSFRRTTLAPILILSGLVVEIFAIFK